MDRHDTDRRDAATPDPFDDRADVPAPVAAPATTRAAVGGPPVAAVAKAFADRRRRVMVGAGAVLAIAIGLGLSTGHAPAEAQAAAAAPPVVPVATVARTEATLFDAYSGRIAAQGTVQVRPRVSGTLEQVHFRDGQQVRKGDLLFTLDAAPFAAEVERARAAVAAARARADLAQLQDQRARRLVQTQAIAQREADERAQGLRIARAELAGAVAALRQAELDLGYTRVTAPIDGRVSRAEITAGNLVGAGQDVLTTVVSVSPVYVDFDIDEAALQRYAVRGNEGVAGMPVRMAVIGEGHPAQAGRVLALDNQVDAGSGTLRVRAEFDNADGRLTPGMLARVELGGAGVQPVVRVADRAIGTDQDKRYVYVVGADNHIAWREVQLGPVSEGQRVITAGLADGERIVTDGLQRLRPGAVIEPRPEPAPAHTAQADPGVAAASHGAGG